MHVLWCWRTYGFWLPPCAKKLVTRVDSEPKSYSSSNPFEVQPSTNNPPKNNPFIPNSNYLVFPFTLGLKRDPIPLLVLVDSGAIENTISKSLVKKYDNLLGFTLRMIHFLFSLLLLMMIPYLLLLVPLGSNQIEQSLSSIVKICILNKRM